MNNSNPVQKKIKPCEMDKPYVFVSYSRSDKDVVWKDVLELQQKGYNIWLDVNNLSTTSSSWAVDAKSAIQNSLCRHILFYVSSRSLCSEPCLRELYEASSLETCMKHSDWNGIGITAIDAEHIPQISVLIETVAQSIPSERDIRRIALEGITAKVFPEGDARNRILYPERDPHTGRCGEKLQAALPDETKCCLAQPDLDAARTVPDTLSVTLLQADQGDPTAMGALAEYFYRQNDWPSTRFWIGQLLAKDSCLQDDSYQACYWHYWYSWCCWQIAKRNDSLEDWKEARDFAKTTLSKMERLLRTPQGVEGVQQLNENAKTILDDCQHYFASQFESLRTQAAAGNAVAQHDIALWLFHDTKGGNPYSVGRGERQQAVQWLKKAAEQNYPPAIYELACCYGWEGCGVSPDADESVRLMRQAAEAGYAPAQFTLAYFYSTGKGSLEKDLEQAAAWCQRAAGQAYPPAVEKIPAYLQRLTDSDS